MGYKFNSQKHIHELNGKPLHGVTSVLKYWGDPNPLLNWGVKTAVDYIEDHRAVWGSSDHDEMIANARKAHTQKRDKAGDKGTEVHSWLEDSIYDLMNGNPFDGERPKVVDDVLNWAKLEGIKFLASEMNVWSEKHWYGGIADGVIEKEGKKYILDFKTSGTVQTKYFYQMGAYSLAVKEMKEHAQVDGVVIVHIPRGKSFDPKKNVYWYTDMNKLEQAWLNILNAYKADKSLQELVAYKPKTSIKI
jgi:hypothetical protein